jgi:hypothetical protein
MGTTQQWIKKFDEKWNKGEFDTRSGNSFNPTLIKSFFFHALQQERQENIDLIIAAHPEIGRRELEYLLSKEE